MKKRLIATVLTAILALSAVAQSETVQFTYDSGGRLTGVYYSGGKSITYVYDASGNLLRRKTTLITDSDGDLMDDAFETTHFTSLSRDGSGDFDDDGQSDLAEFLAGTNPTDPESLLRLTGGGGTADAVTITWAATAGKRYRVQYKEDVSNPAWFDLGGDVTATGISASKTDTTAAASSKRFYRVILLP